MEKNNNILPNCIVVVNDVSLRLYLAIKPEKHNINIVIMMPAIIVNLYVSLQIDIIRLTFVAFNCEIYLVAVTPNPEAPNTINILIVDLTIPSCPNSSFPRIRAQRNPAIRTHNLPKAVPVKVQKAPLIILWAMSDCLILFKIVIIYLILVDIDDNSDSER